MAAQGASLQNYNNQLVACLEDLKEQRGILEKQMQEELTEKTKIEKEISHLAERLSRVNDSLNKKIIARNDYDKAIQETEGAYLKILESSQTLLHVLKRESLNLAKKVNL